MLVMTALSLIFVLLIYTQGALLLSEVLRERDLQVLHKKKRENMHKLQDEAILEYQKKVSS